MSFKIRIKFLFKNINDQSTRMDYGIPVKLELNNPLYDTKTIMCCTD